MDVSCPHCQQVLEVNPKVAGKVRPCPECGEEFKIPFPVARQVHPKATGDSSGLLVALAVTVACFVVFGLAWLLIFGVPRWVYGGH